MGSVGGSEGLPQRRRERRETNGKGWRSRAAGPPLQRQNRLQRLPGSMNLNRPLQVQRQEQRQTRPAKAGRYKCNGKNRGALVIRVGGFVAGTGAGCCGARFV